MGHSSVFSWPYSLVPDLRLSGEQSKGMFLKYDSLHGIGSTSRESRKVGIVGELIPSLCFLGRKIEILSDSS